MFGEQFLYSGTGNVLCRSRQSAVAAFHGVNCPLWSIDQTRIRYSIVATPNEKSPFNNSTNHIAHSTVSRIPDQLGGILDQSPVSLRSLAILLFKRFIMATKSRIKNIPQNSQPHKNYGYGTTAASINLPQYDHKFISTKS